MSPVALVTKPTAADEAKRETVELLRELLAEAESGGISEIYVIMRHPDASWSSKRSTRTDIPALVGRLELAKHSTMTKYLED